MNHNTLIAIGMDDENWTGAFWEVKKFNGLTMKETFLSHTGGNLIVCIVGFIVLCILLLMTFLSGLG